MKKKPKGKQNWFKVQFEKHPYLFTFLIGWTILFYIIDEFILDIVGYRFDYVFYIIFYLFPLIIFFLWFRKNKSKIKPFYKRNKKIFNRVYFYLGSVFSLIPIACIVGIIATGSVSNFTERVKFEIQVLRLTHQGYDFCQSPSFIWNSGYAKEHRLFGFKRDTQFVDYYENDYNNWRLKDTDINNFNHCIATRNYLRAAHGGDQMAKEILTVYPTGIKELYNLNFSKKSKYIFSRYEKNIENMDLNNPAVAHAYAVHLDKKIDESNWKTYDPNFIKPEALKYLEQSAEAGYLIAKSNLIGIYSAKSNFDTSNCDTILKYINTLAKEKSLIEYYTLMFGHMGKTTSERSKAVYDCSNQKPNFSKAFSMLINRPIKGESGYQLRKSADFNSSYQAIFYLNGWGDVEQDYDKAYELFSYNEKIGGNIPSHGYIAYMNFMGMGVEQNPNKGIGLTIELAKNISVDESSQQGIPIEIELLCGGNSYNFIIPDLLSLENIYSKNYYKLPKNQQEKQRKEYVASEKINEKIIKEYRNKIGQCILDSEPEVSIKFLENYIFNRVSDFFQNPELVKTLNYLGEPK